MDTKQPCSNGGAVSVLGGVCLALKKQPGAFSGLVRMKSRDSLLILHHEDIYRSKPFGL